MRFLEVALRRWPFSMSLGRVLRRRSLIDGLWKEELTRRGSCKVLEEVLKENTPSQMGTIAKSGRGEKAKIILTTPTPHISKKYDPKICHQTRGRMA